MSTSHTLHTISPYPTSQTQSQAPILNPNFPAKGPSHHLLKERKRTHLQKTSHRLIGTPNLDLHKSRLITITPRFRALPRRLLCIIPLARPAEDVLPLDPLERLALVDAFGEAVLVRAGLAFEVVGGLGGGFVARRAVGRDRGGYG